MSIDTVELAKTFVENRMQKTQEGNLKAKDMLHDDIEWTAPTMMSSETHKGKEAVFKYWAEQDKKSPKVVSMGEWEKDGELSVSRVNVISTMMMKVSLKQTLTFNADGLIVKSVMVKA